MSVPPHSPSVCCPSIRPFLPLSLSLSLPTFPPSPPSSLIPLILPFLHSSLSLPPFLPPSLPPSPPFIPSPFIPPSAPLFLLPFFLPSIPTSLYYHPSSFPPCLLPPSFSCSHVLSYHPAQSNPLFTKQYSTTLLIVDFEPLSESFNLPLDTPGATQCFDVLIFDDDLFESLTPETFQMEINFPGFTRVRIDPPSTQVNIVDNEGWFVLESCWLKIKLNLISIIKSHR